jgi:hypothetical protein
MGEAETDGRRSTHEEEEAGVVCYPYFATGRRVG